MIFKEYQNIPADWELVRMDSIAQVNPGKKKKVFRDGKWVEAKPDDLVTFLAMEDVSESATILNKQIKPYEEVSTGYTSFQEEDILVAKITPCFENGKGAWALGLKNNIGFGTTEFHVLRVADGINKKWLNYLTSSYYFRKRGELNMQGSAGQKRIPTDFMKSYRLPKPPKKEQDEIADILSTWDEAITKTEKLIEAKKRYKKGLMQRLLSGKVRFPEFEGEEWIEVKLGEVFTERNDKGYENLKLVAITTNNGVIDRDDLDRRDTSSDDKSNYKRILPGDIGYNTMRMWQGVSGYSELEGIVSPAYTIVTPIKDKVDSLFMSYLFKYPPVVDLFRRFSQGLVSDTLNLKYTNFAQIKLKVPPSTKEQKKIASVFTEIDKEIELIKREVAMYQKQKKGLMQKLLTGKVRVSNLKR